MTGSPQFFSYKCTCYFFLARPPCFDFSIASLTCRSSWSLIDWLTISSSEYPDSRAHSGSSDSGKKGVSVPVVPIRSTLRFKSMLHYITSRKYITEVLSILSVLLIINSRYNLSSKTEICLSCHYEFMTYFQHRWMDENTYYINIFLKMELGQEGDEGNL